MAKDFRTDRIRTRAIIGTGSVASGKKNLNLMIYSGSEATNHDGGTGISLTNVGHDVWLYVDGTPSTSANPLLRPHGGSVLFRGDVVVSGTLWSERSVVEVDDSTVGNFQAPKKTIGGHGGTAPDDLQSGFARILVDPTTSNPSANRDGTISFNVVQGSSGDYSYATQFPSKHKDVFFHVSGSRGVKDSNDRGLALFDGDLHTSGNLSVEGSLTLGSALTVPGDLEIGGDLRVGGNDIKNSDNEICITLDADQNVTFAKGIRINNDALTGSDGTVFMVHSGSGDVGIMGSLQVTGNAIKTADGGTAITLDNSDNVTVTNFLKVGGNVIQASDGGSTITLDTDDNVIIAGDLTITGDDIKGSDGNTQITLGGSVLPTIFAGDIQINGKDIKGADGVLALHLSGSGNATFDKNLTVVGDLNVSGSVTTIGTDNLRVKDALILLASGSTTNSTKGGIAIASGSTIDNNSLVFGTAQGTAAPGAFRAGYMDVQDGAITNMDTAQPVDIQAAGLIFKDRTGSGFTTTFVTASINSGATELKIQNDDGSIFLTPNASGVSGVEIADSTALYFDGQGGSKNQQIRSFSNQLRLQHADAGGVLVIGNTGTTAKIRFQGSSHYIFSANDSEGLCITGSRGVNIGSTHAGGESGLILSASSEELVGGPVLVVSASDQFNGATREGYISVGSALSELPALFTNARYRDVRTLISGSVSSRGTNTRGTTLVTGDLVVSGNTKLVGTLDSGALDLSNMTLSSTNVGEPFLRFRDATTQIRRDSSGHMEFTDSQSPSSPYTLTQLAALSVTDNSDVFAVTHQDGTSPFLSYVATTGSFSFDHKDTLDGYTARRTNQIGDNVYFFVSGSIGSAYRESPYTIGDGKRGTAVFGGDVHVSGSLNHTLQDAYATDASGIVANGNGAVIDTGGSGIPVQIRGASAGDESLMAITGSLAFEYSGAGSNAKLHMKSDNAFEFHNSAGEVFRMTAGSSGTNLRLNNNNQINFQDDSRFVYGLTQDSVKKLSIRNNNSGGTVQVHTNGGRMEVTGSLLPGADSTHNLGSPDYRWANLYTGDLHLRNERGNWTIYEEPDMLVVVNNLTGKKYKMGLTPLEDEK
tara:strand:- start:2644 stop:5940 length:3297 start_codon:yes stop_codon:yes gene_type:complete